jgi:hypothetical protein
MGSPCPRASYIDILFFAMVAAFIALRLRSVRAAHGARTPALGGLGPPANGAADNVVVCRAVRRTGEAEAGFTGLSTRPSRP